LQRTLSKTVAYGVGLLATLIALAPVIAIFSSWGQVSGEFWEHLYSTSLVLYIKNSFSLALNVVTLSVFIGVFLAVVTTYIDFPFRKLISILSYSTLVFPPYVMGFILLGMFEYAGPLPTFLREQLRISPNYIPNFSGELGASISLSVSLFPYVYMLTKIALSTRGIRVIEAGKSLGLNFRQCLYKIIIPLATPAILAGALIVLMEVMADFGTVSVYSFDTFTTGIYKAWFGFFDLAAACQLASTLLVFMSLVYFLKIKYQRKDEIYQSGEIDVPKLQTVSPFIRWFLAVGCMSFFLVFLVAPSVQLIWWCLEVGLNNALRLLENNLANTIIIGALTSFVIISYAIFMTYTLRRSGNVSKLVTGMIHFPSMGYAFPGAVLAAGFVTVFASLDLFLDELGVDLGIIFSGSLLILIAGLFVRFYAVGFTPLANSYSRISKSLDEAALSFKVKGTMLFSKVHLPLLKSTLLSSAAFCFIDVVKEMPLTLMARPMGWDTLSVKIFEWTSEGEWEKAAVPSLILVILGYFSLWIMLKLDQNKTKVGVNK
jgi:iron(III) transport system permease protein